MNHAHLDGFYIMNHMTHARFTRFPRLGAWSPGSPAPCRATARLSKQRPLRCPAGGIRPIGSVGSSADLPLGICLIMDQAIFNHCIPLPWKMKFNQWFHWSKLMPLVGSLVLLITCELSISTMKHASKHTFNHCHWSDILTIHHMNIYAPLDLRESR